MEVSVDPLDAIQRSLVCGARVPNMMRNIERLGLDVLKRAIKLLCCEEKDAPKWYHELKKTERDIERKVSIRFSSHMTTLRECTILTKRSADFLLFCAGYFAVAKSSGGSRGIFSGRRVSRRCPIPPPVNLIDTRELIQKMVKHGAGKKGPRRYNVLVGDFRHWFHQIGAPEWMQRLFGIRHKGEMFSWRSLPMGWSWSPYLAQACAWSFLTHRKPDAPPLLDEDMFRGDKGMPRWVRTPQGGFVTVYYDNFLVVTPDESELKAWKERIEENEKPDVLRVVIKPGSLETHTHEQVWNKGFSFLGVHFQTVGKREPVKGRKKEHEPPRKEHRGEPTPEDEELKIWALRVTPLKKEQWLEQLSKERPGTLRTAASWVGKGIFACLCSGDPLQRRESGRRLIEAARAIGRTVTGKQWDTAAAPELWEKAIAAASVSIGGSGETLMFAPVAKQANAKKRVIIASDASKKGYGWVAYVQQGGRLQKINEEWAEHAGQWSDEKKGRHIFLKELECGAQAYAAARRALPKEYRVSLVVDNSAAYYAITNGFSSSERGQNILDEHKEGIAEGDEVIQVVSKDNPSDCHSRGDYREYAERVQRLQEALETHEYGGQRLREHKDFDPTDGRLVRHGEVDSDDEDAPPDEEVGDADEEVERVLEQLEEQAAEAESEEA